MRSIPREGRSHRAVLLALVPAAILVVAWLSASNWASAQTRPSEGPTAVASDQSRSKPGATSTCTPIWNIVSSPSYNTNLNSLYSAAVISANDVWAVGNYGNFN